ncbi:MAG: YjjG family noncanonical pyrimidine nucleotidase [Psychroflexus sp.]|jgi:putative hydrolase of the HAD superfamily|nr:YjjG family noncanonical pyrimidine nucleotidase [Psychroflexus sp.]
MKKPGIKHIFFDLDHTLWDFETNSAITFEKIFKACNVDLQVDKFMTHYTPINHRYWKMYRENKIEQSYLRYSRLKDTFQAVNFEADDQLIDLLSNQYIENLSNETALLPYAKEILNYLGDKYQLHIITNGFDIIQYKKLKNSAIDTFFKTVTTAEEVQLKKPHPKVFYHALDKAQAHKKESLMIGDNLEADIQGAIQIGMQAIHLSDDKNRYKKSITQLDELMRIL